jgi:hypothetical protein
MVKLDEGGQTTVEYILLISIIAGLFAAVSRGLANSRIGDALMKPLNKDFAMAYKYGHPKARGYDEGGPEMHPRITEGNNFRIFINPDSSR